MLSRLLPDVLTSACEPVSVLSCRVSPCSRHLPDVLTSACEPVSVSCCHAECRLAVDSCSMSSRPPASRCPCLVVMPSVALQSTPARCPHVRLRAGVRVLLSCRVSPCSRPHVRPRAGVRVLLSCRVSPCSPPHVRPRAGVRVLLSCRVSPCSRLLPDVLTSAREPVSVSCCHAECRLAVDSCPMSSRPPASRCPCLVVMPSVALQSTPARCPHVRLRAGVRVLLSSCRVSPCSRLLPDADAAASRRPHGRLRAGLRARRPVLVHVRPGLPSGDGRHMATVWRQRRVDGTPDRLSA